MTKVEADHMSTATQALHSRGLAEPDARRRARDAEEASFTTSPKTLARIAGVLYLIVAVTVGYAEAYVRSLIGSSGDAATTADNVRTFAMQLRSAFVVDLVQAIFFLLTTIALYALLKHANGLVAIGMLIFVATGVAVQCLNLLNQYTALTIATSPEYANAFGVAGSNALSKLFVDMQLNGFHIAEIFFAWLVPLGYLVVRSGYFPKLMGVLLMIGGVAYLVDFTAYFLLPVAASTVAPVLAISAVAEVSFILWLLVKGAKTAGSDSTVASSRVA
jgi:Domain of unknown function (DUF4386)